MLHRIYQAAAAIAAVAGQKLKSETTTGLARNAGSSSLLPNVSSFNFTSCCCFASRFSMHFGWGFKPEKGAVRLKPYFSDVYARARVCIVHPICERMHGSMHEEHFNSRLHGQQPMCFGWLITQPLCDYGAERAGWDKHPSQRTYNCTMYIYVYSDHHCAVHLNT